MLVRGEQSRDELLSLTPRGHIRSLEVLTGQESYGKPRIARITLSTLLGDVVSHTKIM